MTDDLDQNTPEQIDQNYSAAMDSVNLINGSKPVGVSNADWADTVSRNAEHLQTMVAKDFWTKSHDLQPLHDAIKKASVTAKELS